MYIIEFLHELRTKEHYSDYCIKDTRTPGHQDSTDTDQNYTLTRNLVTDTDQNYTLTRNLDSEYNSIAKQYKYKSSFTCGVKVF